MNNKLKIKDIPDGWKKRTLEDVCVVKGGYAFKSSLMSSVPSKYQIVKMGTIYNNTFDIKRTPSYINNACEKELEYLLKRNDILISLTGTIGKRDYGYVVQIGQEKNLLVNQRLALLRTNNAISGTFLFNKVKHKTFQDQFFDISKGGTGNQSNVGISALKQIVLLLPPFPEQKRIVAVLETWDEYLEKLNKKIEIKKNIKKGLMQQLLTGKKRLKGFSEKWQTVKLGDLCNVIISNVDKHVYKNEISVYLCNYMDVYYKDKIDSTKDLFKGSVNERELDRFLLKRGDVLITKDSETAEDIAKSCVVNNDFKDVVCGYHLAILRDEKNKVDGNYLKRVFDLPEIQHYFFSLANGATRFGLTKPAIEMAEISLPVKEEQTAIANILTKADEEIEALEEKKALVEAQKEYLLNNLIPGKIRTPVNLLDKV